MSSVGEFTFRKTGEGVFLVDLRDGSGHLGTVQEFTPGEWWAYPADSAGQTQFTAASRQKAAEALRDHRAATTPTPTAPTSPSCPHGHGEMVLRPDAEQTPEQRAAGTWYDCPPGPPGEHCKSSVLVPSPPITLPDTARSSR